MPNTKNFPFRLLIIDRCLSGKNLMTLSDITKEVNHIFALHNENANIQKSTIKRDIDYIEFTCKAIIDRIKSGRNQYVKYADEDFSIFKIQITDEDILKLNEIIDFFGRFEGLPQFEWIEDIRAKIYSATFSDIKAQPVVSFSYNPLYTHSLRHFTPLFNCIITKTPIDLTYKKFSDSKERTYTVHPYHLREYMNRWYLYATVNHHPESISCFAFDRIIEFIKSEKPYLKNTRCDFREYFKQMIGVTNNLDKEPLEVVLWVSDEQWPYLKTSPIIYTQEYVKVAKGGHIIRLKLVINYEFEMLILSYGEKVRVLSPKSFANHIKERIEASLMHYNKPLSEYGIDEI